jgi:hypothetical protein
MVQGGTQRSRLSTQHGWIKTGSRDSCWDLTASFLPGNRVAFGSGKSRSPRAGSSCCCLLFSLRGEPLKCVYLLKVWSSVCPTTCSVRLWSQVRRLRIRMPMWSETARRLLEIDAVVTPALTPFTVVAEVIKGAFGAGVVFARRRFEHGSPMTELLSKHRHIVLAASAGSQIWRG